MKESLVGILFAGLLAAFGIWQFQDQKKNLNELSKISDTEKNRSFKKFLIRQSYRRLQTGVLFFLSGAAMLAGSTIPPQGYPNTCIIIWFAAVLLLLWGMALTIIDIIAIKMRYNEECQVERAAQEGLEYLLNRQQKTKNK